MKIEYKLKVKFLRRLPNPYGDVIEGRKTSEIYEVLIDIRDLPKDINMKTNPRFQNMKTNVVKKIKESLSIDDKSFYLKNRGILLSVKDVKFNNITSEVTLTLDDDTVHGCVDGGHTFRSIQEMVDKINHQHFVRLEIMTGIEDIFESVASSRNTSVAVQEKAIAELKNNFQFIKDFLCDEPFKDNIAYKDNDDKDIDIKYIISMLFMFNIDRLSSNDSAPVQACSGSQSCMKDFLETYKKFETEISKNPYYRLKNIIVDIFKVHDKLQKNIGVYYQQYFNNGRYGQVKGVSASKNKSTFYQETIDYISPKGFVFPILGSFRALIIEDKDGFYTWAKNPFEYLDRIGPELVGETIERHRSLGNSPGNVGKDSNHWKQLYRRVLTEYLLENNR